MICALVFVTVAALLIAFVVVEGQRLERAILLLLIEGPDYGLEIAARIKLHPDGMGAIYSALRSLERRGLLVSWEWPEALEIRGGRPRRFYALTPAGRALAHTMRDAE